MSAPGHSTRADLVLVGITALWGLSFLIVKDGLTLADPLSFVALRFVLGAVLVTPFCIQGLRGWPVWRDGLVLAVLLFAGFVLQTYGLVHTAPSRSAFITALCTPLVPWVALVLLGQRPRPSALVGIALAVAGLYVMTRQQLRASGPTLWGDLLTLASAVMYAFHITLLGKYARRAAALPLVAVQFWGTALLAGAALLAVPPRVQWTSGLFATVALAGVLSTALAMTLQTWAQARTTPVRAALIFVLEPIFAAVFSTALGREQLGWREVVGGAIVIAGVLVGELGPLVSGVRAPRRAAT